MKLSWPETITKAWKVDPDLRDVVSVRIDAWRKWNTVRKIGAFFGMLGMGGGFLFCIMNVVLGLSLGVTLLFGLGMWFFIMDAKLQRLNAEIVDTALLYLQNKALNALKDQNADGFFI